MKNKIVIIILLSIFILVGIVFIYMFSKSNDVISKYANSSINELINRNDKNIVIEDDTALNIYSMQLPSGDKFVIDLKDNENSQTSVRYVLRLQPFINAGLNIEKLPEYMTANIAENTLIINHMLEQKEYISDAKKFEEAVQIIISNYREKVEYHSILGHFGISLENGNKFEWAKDIDSNDKDIVFVLDPEIFKSLGVNINEIEDWKYAEIPVSATKKVFKLVQPYNMENN